MISNEYGIESKQRRLLNLLKNLDQLLSDNGITYSLSSGTLLGAIRHQGFIPWDDDIDIMVTRDNHKKICNLFNSRNAIRINDADYQLDRHLWVYRIKELRDDGIKDCYVDVFVVDNCPDNRFVNFIKNTLIRCLQGMMKERIETEGKSFIYIFLLFVTHIFGKLFSEKKKMLFYEKASLISSQKTTKSVSVYNDEYRLVGVTYPSTLMEKTILVKFENLFLPITKDYEFYLTKQYGDYMTLPPKEERKPQHC